MNEFVRIKQQWLQHTPRQWWGDDVDVRFYLLARLKHLRNRCILDVGCNAGLVLSELDASNVKYGFDLNDALLPVAQSLNPGAVLAQSSCFEGFPYQDQSFDVVIMANVMPYHEIAHASLPPQAQKAHVLNEVYRVLRPGGKLLLTTPNGEHPCYAHTRRIQVTELQQDLRRFGRVHISGWNPLPCVMGFLPRSWQRRIPPRYHKYLFLPSPLLARLPGIMPLFQWLMRKKFLRNHAKAFYVECEK